LPNGISHADDLAVAGITLDQREMSQAHGIEPHHE
jgi:hypothetical protein